MARGRQEKAKARRGFREPEMREYVQDLIEQEGEPFGDVLRDPGADEYIWPECGPEDEDEL